jgi:hypothetical protein
MSECWSPDPWLRPSFPQICHRLYDITKKMSPNLLPYISLPVSDDKQALSTPANHPIHFDIFHVRNFKFPLPNPQGDVSGGSESASDQKKCVSCGKEKGTFSRQKFITCSKCNKLVCVQCLVPSTNSCEKCSQRNVTSMRVNCVTHSNLSTIWIGFTNGYVGLVSVAS